MTCKHKVGHCYNYFVVLKLAFYEQFKHGFTSRICVARGVVNMLITLHVEYVSNFCDPMIYLVQNFLFSYEHK